MAESRAELMWSLDELEAAAWRDLIDAAPPAVVTAIGLAYARIAGTTVLTAPGLASPIVNRALGIGNGEPATDALVDEVIVRFAVHAVRDPWIQISPAARPASLAPWLAARGFAPAPRAAVVKAVRGREPVAAIESDLAVRELDARDAAALAKVLCAAHRVPDVVAPAIEAIVGRRRWRAYGAFDGGVMIAAGFAYCDDRRAWLGLGGTLPAHRGRGAQAVLLARRIDDALAHGATTIATETDEPRAGEPRAALDNLARCGFRVAGARTNWALVR